VYEAFDDPNCYPGTSVLRNRLDLTDQDDLTAFEVDSVTLRAEEPFPEGEISPLLFRAFHHHLFQDVYAWAGELRTVRIHRDQSTFCYPEHIAASLERLFAWLAGEDYLVGLTPDEFADRGAHLLSELNVIHAFREGNGRTQMAFFTMLAARAGHPLDLERLDPDGFLDAMIAAFNGHEGALARQLRQII
jgi:cell filamentation protein